MDTLRGKVTQLTHTTAALGHALADLGEAVAHTGTLPQLTASPRSPQRSKALDATRAMLHARIDDARARLHQAGACLHQEADRPTLPEHAPTPPHSRQPYARSRRETTTAPHKRRPPAPLGGTALRPPPSPAHHPGRAPRP